MRLLYLYAPFYCPVCGSEQPPGELCCPTCWSLLLSDRLTPEDRCQTCFSKLEQKECSFCSDRNIYFDRHISLFGLSRAWREVLHCWKFENERLLYRLFLPTLRSALESHFATELNQAGAVETLLRASYLTSGRSGYDLRSYTPCLDICHVLEKEYGFTSGNDIYKQRGFKQSGQGYADRFFQIAGGYRLKPELSLQNYQSYFLVEDLFTTGATANQAARLLKEQGVARVYIISMLMRESVGRGDVRS